MYELNEKDIEAIQYSVRILFKQCENNERELYSNYNISYNESKALDMKNSYKGQILNKKDADIISYLIESLENYDKIIKPNCGIEEYLERLL